VFACTAPAAVAFDALAALAAFLMTRLTPDVGQSALIVPLLLRGLLLLFIVLPVANVTHRRLRRRGPHARRGAFARVRRSEQEGLAAGKLPELARRFSLPDRRGDVRRYICGVAKADQLSYVSFTD